MKRIFLAAFISLGLLACNNETNNEETTTEQTDAEIRGDGERSDVHPPQEGIPDSLRLANDSVIVPQNH